MNSIENEKIKQKLEIMKKKLDKDFMTYSEVDSEISLYDGKIRLYMKVRDIREWGSENGQR